MMNTGWIAHHGYAGWNAFGNHRTHPYNRAAPNHQWAPRLALLDDGTGADICVVFDDDISIAFYPRGEGNEIADDAVMLHVTIKVRVEMSPNPDIACERDEWTKDGTFANDDIVQLHDISSPNLEEPDSVGSTTLHQSTTNTTVRDRNVDPTLASGLL